MTYLVKSALLVAALSVPLMAGFAPTASATGSATVQTGQYLLSTKSDRGTTTPTAQMILATIAAEGK